MPCAGAQEREKTHFGAPFERLSVCRRNDWISPQAELCILGAGRSRKSSARPARKRDQSIKVESCLAPPKPMDTQILAMLAVRRA